MPIRPPVSLLAARRLLLLAAALVATVLSAAPADEVEWNGVLIAGGQTQVSLLDLRTGAAQWVPVGGEFAGYVVSAYDPVQDCIALTRQGRPVAGLRLKNAVILVAAPLAPWVQPSNEQRAAVVENLRLLAAAAQQHFADTGLDTATVGDLVGPGELLPELTPAAGESYAGLVLRRDTPAISLLTPDGTTISSDGTSTAADGSVILPDGSRVTTAGTHLAPDGSIVGSSGPATTGPFIPPSASPVTAAALEAAGWHYRPASAPSVP